MKTKTTYVILTEAAIKKVLAMHFTELVPGNPEDDVEVLLSTNTEGYLEAKLRR